jgi:hypothetical protein
MSSIRATLMVNGQSLTAIFEAASSVLQDELEAEMTAILRARGKVVETPLQWETPGEISARLGISPNKFCYRIKDPLCPKPHDVIRKSDGRIMHLRSHSTLDAFLANHKTKTS